MHVIRHTPNRSILLATKHLSLSLVESDCGLQDRIKLLASFWQGGEGAGRYEVEEVPMQYGALLIRLKNDHSDQMKRVFYRQSKCFWNGC